MQAILVILVLALALPLTLFATPLLMYVVPLVLLGLAISYLVRDHDHRRLRH